MKTEPGAARIGPPTLFALLLVALSGTDFLSAPYDAAHYCGPSGYWAVVLSFCLAVPLIFLLLAVQRRFPGRSLLEFGPEVLGKFLGTIGNLLLLLSLYAWFVLALRDAGDLVLAYLMNRTPVWVVLVFFIIGIGYIAGNGISALTRLAAFVLIPTVVIRIAMKMLSFQGARVSHLLPLFAAGPLDYLRGGLALSGLFTALVSLSLINPLIDKPERLRTVVFSAAGAAALLVLTGVTGTIALFGADLTVQYAWPNLASIHHISLPYLVLEQVGLIFIIAWLTMFMVAMAFYLYLAAHGLARQFGVRDFRWFAAALAALALAIGLFLPNAAVIHSLFALIRHWAIVPTAGYILLTYAMALIRGKGVLHGTA